MSNSLKRKAKPTSSGMQAKKHHWSAGLLETMKDPESIVKEDDKIIVIKDKYPKARLHFLVLPKVDIHSIWHITAENKDLLFYMDQVAEDLAEQHKEHEFKIGYHAKPSMQRLHLHVISTDFDSLCLKNKYHWNSFTTPFFLSSKDICKQLHENGTLKKISSEECTKYLNTPLKCHKCSVTPKNMPELKRHLLTHLSNKEEA